MDDHDDTEDAGINEGEAADEGGSMLGNDGDDGKEEQPQAADEELVNPVADLAGQDADIQEEAESQRALRDPGSPSKADREEHDLTHLPYRPWCDACVRGRAKDKMSLRLTEAYSHLSLIHI